MCNIYIYTYIYIYIYIYIGGGGVGLCFPHKSGSTGAPSKRLSRQTRHSTSARLGLELSGKCPTVGFHNFNLRIFDSRVSNPEKLIVEVCLTRCRISMCQGSGPKKHDEISEIDRSADPRSSFPTVIQALTCNRMLGPAEGWGPED